MDNKNIKEIKSLKEAAAIVENLKENEILSIEFERKEGCESIAKD